MTLVKSKYRIWDAQMQERTSCVAEYFEIIGEHIVFYSNYDVRKTVMVIKLGPGWSVTKDEE